MTEFPFNLTLPVKKLDKTATIPEYAHQGDAGMDLFSNENLRLNPGERHTVKTGIAVAIPKGYMGYVQTKSGIASKQGVFVLNTPGLIDSNYRGEVGVILFNTSREPYYIKRGDKVAQLVIVPFETVNIKDVDELDDTIRGTAGFGSTGIRKDERCSD